MVAAIKDFDDLLPSEQESAQARESSRVLSTFACRTEPLQIEVKGNERQEVVSLPAGAVRLLLDLLTEMAEGNAVTLMPMHAELTHATGGRHFERVPAVSGQAPGRGDDWSS